VYVYFPKVDQASTKVSIVLRSGKTEKEIIVRPNEIKVEGQTSGEWVSLGKHQFVKNESSAVEVTTSDADGVVIADAVLLIPE
jgi:hypothetical protein